MPGNRCQINAQRASRLISIEIQSYLTVVSPREILWIVGPLAPTIHSWLGPAYVFEFSILVPRGVILDLFVGTRAPPLLIPASTISAEHPRSTLPGPPSLFFVLKATFCSPGWLMPSSVRQPLVLGARFALGGRFLLFWLLGSFLATRRLLSRLVASRPVGAPLVAW